VQIRAQVFCQESPTILLHTEACGNEPGNLHARRSDRVKKKKIVAVQMWQNVCLYMRTRTPVHASSTWPLSCPRPADSNLHAPSKPVDEAWVLRGPKIYHAMARQKALPEFIQRRRGVRVVGSVMILLPNNRARWAGRTSEACGISACHRRVEPNVTASTHCRIRAHVLHLSRAVVSVRINRRTSLGFDVLGRTCCI
jgi:hypothetical protein